MALAIIALTIIEVSVQNKNKKPNEYKSPPLHKLRGNFATSHLQANLLKHLHGNGFK